MSSFEKKDAEFFFKKDEPSESCSSKSFVSQTEDRKDESSTDERPSSDATSNDDESSWEDVSSSGDDSSSDDETSSEDETCSETSSEDETCSETSSEDETCSETSSEDETCSEDESCSENEIDEEYNNEDNLISKLYRQVVDVLMDSKKLTESVVDTAIRDIKLKLHKAHKRGYRKCPRIDFSRPENCCGYLRRYAICYTGLVKKMMWNFFTNKKKPSKAAKDIISNSYLKIVSLGGGPGNDLVGFCSALQEIPNSVEQLELTVVDIGAGWKHVFPEILNKAKDTNFGSFSQCAQKNINCHFIKADLANGDVFRDANLSAALDQADLILMVKLISYLPGDVEPGSLIYTIVDSMKPDAKLVFIDIPYDGQFFREIESLDCIYRDALRYELCFKQRRTQSPSIVSTFAHVAIHQKRKIQDEDSSGSEEN